MHRRFRLLPFVAVALLVACNEDAPPGAAPTVTAEPAATATAKAEATATADAAESATAETAEPETTAEAKADKPPKDDEPATATPPTTTKVAETKPTAEPKAEEPPKPEPEPKKPTGPVVGKPWQVVASAAAEPGYKCNDMYKHKFVTAGGSNVTYPTAKPRGSCAGKRGIAVTVPFVPTAAGPGKVSGTLRYGICDDAKTNCKVVKKSMTLPFTATAE